ncbi:signal peptidase I [Arthrobacter sp. MYb227]|uniref:signal peptidase I n=1 Tax=Arthrobacter sp. MYb227 TaxID=1848601 RepID=UPI000CFCB5C7|nr:signal peptidase I [Arthrobacter sp. MYb227]PQZ94906.1 signal peptidase I [Arthrobacter sp. MYb227]
MSELTRAQLRREREKTSALWWIAQTSSWLALFIVVSLLAVMIGIPRLGGATAYTVLTGSMRPGFPPGTLMVVKPVDPNEIRPGDVVTYQLKPGEPTVVTHRVVGVGKTAGGEQRFTLRGDANNANDPLILPEQIRGSLWYSVPILGFLNSAISGEQRTWLTWLAVGGLLTYAFVMLIGAWREKRTVKST